MAREHFLFTEGRDLLGQLDRSWCLGLACSGVSWACRGCLQAQGTQCPLQILGRAWVELDSCVPRHSWETPAPGRCSHCWGRRSPAPLRLSFRPRGA